jgi:hypothetical protein
MKTKNYFIIVLICGVIFNCTDQKTSEKIVIGKEKNLIKESIKSAQIDSFEIEYQKLDFKPFITKKNIGKEIVTSKSKDAEYFTRYLGTIDLGENKYHVISQFYTIQAAIVKHGHSRIIFLDSNLKIKKIYNLSMPNELPIAITANELIFNIDNKKYNLNLGKGISSMICIPNNEGCY